MAFDDRVLEQGNLRSTPQPQEELQLIKFLMDRVADAVFWVDPNAQFLYVNEQACCLVGHSREKLLSMTMHDVDLDFSVKVWSEYWKTIKQQGSLNFESPYQTKEGRRFKLGISLSYMEYQSREYCCIFARKVTECNHTESSLQKDNEVLEARVAERTAELRNANALLYRKIAEHKRTQAELENSLCLLQQSEARFRTLAETTNVIIFINQGTQFCYVNPAAEAITGYKREELLAYPDIRKLIKKHEQAHRSDELVPVQHEEIKQCEEIKILTKNGEERWLDCCVGAIEFEGKLTVLGTAIDTTKRKQAEVEIRQALEQEKELGEVKARFVSMVSHEFRTPLNIISFSTSLVRRHSQQWSEEKKLQYLHRIQTAVEQLTQLMDGVLIIGRAEAGKLTFEPRELDLDQFCRDVVAEMQLSDSSQHTFTFESIGDCSTACVDEKLLQPILTNLLSNAIKYSPVGSTVDLTLSCQDEEVIFKITDRGIGIPAADQQRMFEPFHRGRNVGDILGTGLGLAVVKKLVDVHGGQIATTSEVGVGSTFAIALPLHQQVEAGASIPLIFSTDEQLNIRRDNEKDSCD